MHVSSTYVLLVSNFTRKRIQVNNPLFLSPAFDEQTHDLYLKHKKSIDKKKKLNTVKN